MADTVFKNVSPPMKAVDLGDGTYSLPATEMFPEKRRAMEDGLQSIACEHRLGRSLNDFFNGAITTVAGVRQRIDLDEYWTSTGLQISTGYRYVGAYSRKAFQYPTLTVYTKLLTLAAGQIVYFGFEQGSDSRLWHPMFWESDIAVFSDGSTNLLMTSLLPSDYATALHNYVVKINRCNAEFFIDNVLKGIILAGVPEAIQSYSNVNPYVIASNNQSSFAAFPSLLEVDNSGNELLFPLDPIRFVAADGDPLPPRQYALYTVNTATKWAGLTTAGALLTSHPVPIWGYTRKTLLFQANAAGSLVTQVYAGGGWRTIDTKTLVANTLYPYSLSIAATIARCTYDPVNNDVITVAEWYLEA